MPGKAITLKVDRGHFRSYPSYLLLLIPLAKTPFIVTLPGRNRKRAGLLPPSLKINDLCNDYFLLLVSKIQFEPRANAYLTFYFDFPSGFIDSFLDHVQANA